MSARAQRFQTLLMLASLLTWLCNSAVAQEKLLPSLSVTLPQPVRNVLQPLTNTPALNNLQTGVEQLVQQQNANLSQVRPLVHNELAPALIPSTATGAGNIQAGQAELANIGQAEVTQARMSSALSPLDTAPKVFAVSSIDALPGAHTVRRFEIAGPLVTPTIFPSDGAHYQILRNGGVLFQSGQLLVSTVGKRGSSLVTMPDGTRLMLARSTTALITGRGGVLQIINTAGDASSLHVNRPGEAPIGLALGHELTTTVDALGNRAVTLADNIARRNTTVLNNRKAAISEVSLPTLLTRNSLLKGILQGTVSGADRLLASALAKAAASQLLVRGTERFALNTVEGLVNNVVPGVLPPIPTVPPVTVPPLPGAPPTGVSPTALAGAGSAPSAATAPPSLLPTATTPNFGPLTAGNPVDQTLPLLRSQAATVPRNRQPGRRGTGPRAGSNASAAPTPTGPSAAPPAVPPTSASNTAAQAPNAPGHAGAAAPGTGVPTVFAPASAPLPWYLLPLTPFLNGVPLNQLPGAVGEQIRRHPNIAAALLVLFLLLLALTTYFWWQAHRRSKELSALNVEMAKARDQAIAGSKAKSEFMANISHEIRTPISAIMGLVDMLFQTKPTSEQSSLLTMLKQAAQQLAGLLTSVLDFSKIDAGRLTLEHVPFDLPLLLSEAANQFRMQAEEKGLEFIVELDKSLPPRVMGDPVRLRQVVSNLISNAIKFTARGSVSLRAIAEQPHDRTLVNIQVKDSGIGISKEEQSRIFEPFVQADASTTRMFGGTGLGLSISKRLVTLMGGELNVESEKNSGSLFSVLIPMEVAASMTNVAGSRTDTGTAETTASALAGARILVAEDSPVLSRIVQAQLKRLGCNVDLVNNGEQALAAVRTQRYAAILMDWQMPVLDGLQATQAIRRLPDETAKTPIIAMTANAMEGDRTACLNAGCSDYISKPFSPEQLRTVLERWVHQ